jgi:peptidoglycan/xylan/chitin deacetylase (PgdA/CDA1 family)
MAERRSAAGGITWSLRRCCVSPQDNVTAFVAWDPKSNWVLDASLTLTAVIPGANGAPSTTVTVRCIGTLTRTSAPTPMGKVAYLTFDDGPDPQGLTKKIGDHLQSIGAKATYFVIGRDIDASEEL